MENPYWVGDYYVEPARNQIRRFEQTNYLQPKVLAVLNLLAKHSGKVVSHDTLMEKVWPNVYVSPNTLQRCIAELRKALGDDSKLQNIIKTHSKQGYSLEVKVLWNAVSIQAHTPPKKILTPIRMAVIVLAFWLLLPSHNPDKPYDQITAMTASDEKEYYPDYSPDGKFMVFHRYLDVCENHIWAKDLATQKEIRLTQKSAVYGQHSWSTDGSQLAFTVQENCSENNVEQKRCWQLHTLDFAEALKQPQSSTLRLNCNQEQVSDPLWMSDGSILMMQYKEQVKLVRYDSRLDKLSDFYTPTDNTELLNFDVAPDSERVAIFKQDEKANRSWVITDIQGRTLDQTSFSIPDGISGFQRFEPRFTHDEQAFYVNTGQGLFKMAFNGEFSPVAVSSGQRLFTPSFSNDGNKIIATQGVVDSDIALVSLGLDNVTSADHYASIARSNSYDAGGKFQPGTNNIAFNSRRSGSSQIWLMIENHVSQLSKFKPRTQLSNFVWSPDGKRIAVIANDRLILINMLGETQSIEVGYPLGNVFQWVDDDYLLLEGNLQLKSQIMRYQISSGQSEYTGVADVYWANLTTDGALLYIDQQRKLRSKSNNLTVEIPALEGQLDGKRFVMKNQQLYGINWQQQLWRFDVATEQFALLENLHSDTWWVSDIKDNKALITQIISSKKEIIEISRR